MTSSLEQFSLIIVQLQYLRVAIRLQLPQVILKLAGLLGLNCKISTAKVLLEFCHRSCQEHTSAFVK